MTEKPYIIVDNVLSDATTVATSLTAVTGFEISKVYDNLHHTSFKTTSATSPEAITITPSVHAKVNCVIIDSMFSDTSGYYQVTINGASVVNTQATQDIVEGVIILPFTETVVISGGANAVINIYSTLTTKQLRHVCLGYYHEIKNPQLPHDPIPDEQVNRTQFNEDGAIINNAPIYTHRILDASWTMISPTDWTAFDYLRTNSFYTGTPFWYFLHPTSEPTVGHLYHWDKDSYVREFELAGYRNFAVRARANVSPDRTPNRYPFGFSKGLRLNGSTQYGTISLLSLGTVHSIEFWINSAEPAGIEYILGGLDGADESYINFQPASDWIAYLPAGDATGAVATYTPFSNGTMTHFIITRTAGTVNFYQNNVLLTNTANITTAGKVFKVTRLGARQDNSGKYTGDIGHVRCYNWVLTSAQRTRQYNGGLGNSSLNDGKYFAWEFDETGGTSTSVEQDGGLLNNDLTLVGTPSREAW